MKFKLMLILLVTLSSSSAFAHGQHCHVTDANGVSIDDPSAATKSECAAKGGTWAHHHLHCHTKDAAGNLVDLPKVTNKADCEKQSGSWEDHKAASAAPESK